mmetsp:Transcript_101972/g.283787  ORF Transcript_101972/g.283787 Transcript_101972/m.283787 type:complete len:241 (-) Transcript_101972:27-749(-)
MQREAHVRGNAPRNFVDDVNTVEELLQGHLAEADHEEIPWTLDNAIHTAPVLLHTLYEGATLRLGVEDEGARDVPTVLVFALIECLPQQLEDRGGLHTRQAFNPVDRVLQLPTPAEASKLQEPLHANADLPLPEGQLCAILLGPKDRGLVDVVAAGPDVPLLAECGLALVDDADPPREPVLPGEVEVPGGPHAVVRRGANRNSSAALRQQQGVQATRQADGCSCRSPASAQRSGQGRPHR